MFGHAQPFCNVVLMTICVVKTSVHIAVGNERCNLHSLGLLFGAEAVLSLIQACTDAMSQCIFWATGMLHWSRCCSLFSMCGSLLRLHIQSLRK